MKKFLAIAMITAAPAFAPAALAHEGHAHKVMGTVVSITADQIEVTTVEDKKEVLTLTTKTVFKKDKATITAKDVAVGARVVLSVVEKDGKKSVSEVQLGIAPPPPAKPQKQ